MSTYVTTVPVVTPPVICNFGWYHGSPPMRFGPISYTIDGNTYPPGQALTHGVIALPTSVIQTTSSLGILQEEFEPSGILVLSGGLVTDSPSPTLNPSPTLYPEAPLGTTITYTSIGMSGGYASFLGCAGGSGTYGSGTLIYDGRFYIEGIGINTEVIFDAIDSQALFLPLVQTPTGVSIVGYHWDFGNGQIGNGPTASTTYTYNVAPPSCRVSLTVLDSLGRTASCAHCLQFS